MAGRRFPRLPGRDRLTDGIEVKPADGGIEIDLHVVVEDGLNLAEVAATVRNRLAYEVERQTGLSVSAVEVRIEDVRRSSLTSTAPARSPASRSETWKQTSRA